MLHICLKMSLIIQIVFFNQYIDDNFVEVCRAGGVVGFEDGKVKCSLHGNASEDDKNDEPGEEVPWL